jgi:hypothetical protein
MECDNKSGHFKDCPRKASLSGRSNKPRRVVRRLPGPICALKTAYGRARPTELLASTELAVYVGQRLHVPFELAS